MTGMGIKRGITIVIGSAFHNKTTLEKAGGGGSLRGVESRSRRWKGGGSELEGNLKRHDREREVRELRRHLLFDQEPPGEEYLLFFD